MQVREGHTAEAVRIARELGRVFPENRQLAMFLEGHEPVQLPWKGPPPATKSP
jgi:hypothetical protein